MYNLYKINDGESLEDIATKFSMPLDDLVAINDLDIDNLERAKEIIVPDNSKKYFEYYNVKQGDSLYAVARRYNVNPELLMTLNGLNYNDYIYPNQVILIPKANYSYYVTKAGDTLDSVANTLDVNRDKLLNDNSIVYLLEGQLLVKEK